MATPKIIAKTEIIAQVRRIINEPTALFYTDLEITEWIDRAARNVSTTSLTNWVATAEQVTLVQATSKYALANKYLKIESVTYDTTIARVGMQQVHPRHFGKTVIGTTGIPIYFTIFGTTATATTTTLTDEMWVYPTPGATPPKLDIYGYTMIAGDYGATGSELLQGPVQQLVLDYVLSCCYTKAQKHSLAGYYMKRYMSAIMVARRIMYDQIKVVESHDMVKVPDMTIQAGQAQG